MKRLLSAFVMIMMLFCRTGFCDEESESDYYGRTGSGAMDSASEGISISMMGWGIGLAIGIAILAGVLHQSQSDSGGGNGHNHCQ